jgi:competence protein ComGC
MANFISTHPNLSLAIALAIFILLVIWLVYLTLTIKNYFKERKQVLKEIKGKGLDRVLEGLQKQIQKLNLETKELYAISEQLAKIAVQSITKIGMVRYNPFGDVGGDQSFSIALLNNNFDGMVISSLHGREGTRIYAKPLVKGQSKYHLSEEEEEAIKKSLS